MAPPSALGAKSMYKKGHAEHRVPGQFLNRLRRRAADGAVSGCHNLRPTGQRTRLSTVVETATFRNPKELNEPRIYEDTLD